MENRIVMDSSGDLQEMEGVSFACAPLKIFAGNREFVDDKHVDVPEMVHFLREYKGKTSTACPSVGEYLESFADAENVYCVTITSSLSGSYNAATVAAKTWKEQHPDRNIHILDSLSAGPEMTLLAEKLRELILQKLPFDKIVQQITEYHSKTRLAFSLESLHNLANNGRVLSAVAAVTEFLGIRLIGRASEGGELQPIGKVRGEKKVASELLKSLKKMGYAGGKVRIAHCLNLKTAENLRSLILEQFPIADIKILAAGALCSFYAEQGGLLVGFEIA